MIFSSNFSSMACRKELNEKAGPGAEGDEAAPVSAGEMPLPAAALHNEASTAISRCLAFFSATSHRHHYRARAYTPRARFGGREKRAGAHLIAGVSLMESRNSMAALALPSQASSTLLMTSGSMFVNWGGSRHARHTHAHTSVSDSGV